MNTENVVITNPESPGSFGNDDGSRGTPMMRISSGRREAISDGPSQRLRRLLERWRSQARDPRHGTQLLEPWTPWATRRTEGGRHKTTKFHRENEEEEEESGWSCGKLEVGTVLFYIWNRIRINCWLWLRFAASAEVSEERVNERRKSKFAKKKNRLKNREIKMELEYWDLEIINLKNI